MSGGMKKMKKRTVSFPRFYGVDNSAHGNAGGALYAEGSYNFDMNDGSLRQGLGAEYAYNLSLPEKCVALYFYRRDDALSGEDDRIIILGTSGKLYQKKISSGSFAQISGVTFSSRPIGVCYNYNGEDVMIFANADDGAYVYDGSAITPIPSAPPITSACIHYERLFATSDGGKTLWFSDDFDPANWSISLTEAGFIDLGGFRGELLKAVSFLDHVYVFRSYGITRVSAYGDQTQFSVSDLFVSSGKILRDSITFCGDRIIFAATDGFYVFDGISATRILGGLDGTVNFSKEEIKGKFFNGKAYFTVYVKRGNSNIRSVLVYDLKSGSYYLSEGHVVYDIELIDGRSVYDLYFLSTAGTRLYRFNSSGKNLSTSLYKRWKSKACDFGVRKSNKIMTELSLYTETDITVTVDNGTQSAAYAICGGKGRKTVRPNIKGENFSVEIFCGGAEANVSGLTMKFAYYDE
ncbi:MAG: hypothetical protein J5903_03330 [Clostridia bacterium]|nr:hypothetical protein [Clostridia bacterium]